MTRQQQGRNRRQFQDETLTGEGLAQLIAKFGLPLLKQLGISALGKIAEKGGEAIGERVGDFAAKKIKGGGMLKMATDSNHVFQGQEAQLTSMVGKGSARAGAQDNSCCVGRGVGRSDAPRGKTKKKS